jgi:hypothetical protein
VVVEGDRPVEVGQGYLQRTGHVPEGIIREIAIAIMECVKEGKKGGGLIFPLGDERIVGTVSHFQPPKGEDATNRFPEGLLRALRE